MWPSKKLSVLPRPGSQLGGRAGGRDEAVKKILKTRTHSLHLFGSDYEPEFHNPDLCPSV